ncbi:hypothetical protein Tco_0956499 [Tanacetum coccineum]
MSALRRSDNENMLSYDESNTYVLERFNTTAEILVKKMSSKLTPNLITRFDSSAGNPVKDILLKLNLPDHRILKDGHGGTCSS